MRVRLGIAGGAVGLGYCIRSIASGAYVVAPLALVLLVLLVLLIRSTPVTWLRHERTMLRLVRVEQITPAAPSQWWAWDADGNKYYLRYRFGKGAITLLVHGGDLMYEDPVIRRFRHGDGMDSYITIDEFAALAKVDVSQISEEQSR
jgi:hypothetical protein